MKIIRPAEFKKGDKIKYTPVLGLKFADYVTWEVAGVDIPRQQYWLVRFDGNQSRSRVLNFKMQNHYRKVDEQNT